MSTGKAYKPLWLAVAAKLASLTVTGIGAVTIAETVGPDNAFPFVTFAVAFPRHGASEGDAALEVHAWDNQNAERVIDILDAVNTKLDHAVLTWAGGTGTILASSTPSIGKDPDGSTRHGVQIYRVAVHV